LVNDVVLNQVLVGFGGEGAEADARTDAVIARIQQDRTCWMGGTTWRGRRLMRIAVSNYPTTTDHVDASVAAHLRAVRDAAHSRGMRAITIPEPGETEALVLADVAAPAVGRGEVLIDVVAAGVNRADIMQRKGFYPPPEGESELPGLEVSGTIAKVGDGVDDWSVGDQVCALLS